MPAVLLRLLLILTLVLNGSGAAMASVRMAQQIDAAAVSVGGPVPMQAATHQAPQAAASQAADTHADAAVAAAPCHDMPGMAHAGQATNDTAQTAISGTPQRDDGSAPHAPSPSHCDGGTCQCACLHVAQAMTALPRVPAIGAGVSAMPQPAIDAHADPALPHLIRPPIA